MITTTMCHQSHTTHTARYQEEGENIPRAVLAPTVCDVTYSSFNLTKTFKRTS